MNTTKWHPVRSTQNGFYYVTRFPIGCTEDDPRVEYLPQRWTNGEQAAIAAHEANGEHIYARQRQFRLNHKRTSRR